MTREDYGLAYEEGSRRTERFLRSRGIPPDSAQDFAQTAWLRGWERLHQLRDERLLVTWINTIALNASRRSMYYDRPFQPLSEAIGASLAGSSLNEAAIDLSRIIMACRPVDRMSLEAQLAGLTPKEIATANGLSEVAIRVRFSRARRAARLGVQKSAAATQSQTRS